MNPTKLIQVNLRNYKLIDNITINISKNLTCILGDNATGKTSILQTISRHYTSSSTSDHIVHATWKLRIDVSDIDELNKCGIDSIKVLYRQAGTWDNNIEQIDGIQPYLKKVRHEAKSAEKNYLENITKMKELFQDIEQKMDSFPDVDGIWRSMSADVLMQSKDKIQGAITQLDEMLNGKDILDIILPNLSSEFPDTNHRIDMSIFELPVIAEERYQRFKLYYEHFTVEDHGFEIDWTSLDKRYYEVKKMTQDVHNLLIDSKKRYGRLSCNADDMEDGFCKIIAEIQDVRNKIERKCSDFIQQTRLISSSDNFENKFSNPSDFEKQLRSFLGVGNSVTNGKELSDGERWACTLSNRIAQVQNNLIILDEPGMFLNPYFHSRLLDMFEFLTTKGYQILYTTHIPLLVPQQKQSKVYLTSDSSRIKLREADFGEIEEQSKIVIGDLFIRSTRLLLLVEGINDKILFDYLLKLFVSVDESKIDIFDCQGHGVIQIIEFCISLKIEFRAIVDLDKKEDIQKHFRDLDNKFSRHIYYVGTTDIQEIEGEMTENDRSKTCCDCNGEPKMYYHKLVAFIKSGDSLSSDFTERMQYILEELELNN